MHSSALNRRKLWAMSCETLFQNAAASVAPEMLGKLYRRYQIPLPDADRGKVALYQVAHEYCHHDSPFSRHIQRYLNRKHIALITQFALCQPENLRVTVEALIKGSQTTLPDTLPGILWAVSSDPREAVRPLEKLLIDELHWLSHCLLLAQFQGNVRILGPEVQLSEAEREAMHQELEHLKAERCTLRQEIQQHQHRANRLTKDNAQLQRQLKVLKRRCETLEQQRTTVSADSSAQGVTQRDLKKLQYEVGKLTQALREKENETQHLMALVSSESITANPVGEGANEPLSALPEAAWPSIDLSGKTVALIGGLTKASMHYEQAIHQLGGNCVRHAGSAHQGQKKLANIIRQADMVFCPVDCVSHGTATSAKKLCRTLDKPCYFLRSSGISHIREKLREVARYA